MTLPPVYSPSEIESRWYSEWEKNGFFKPDTNAPEGPFSIVIPPPNVTGILHMGHALNNTIQDILVRYKRMRGFAALWVPGTDHAGIATQNVVERQLAKEKITRHQLGRDQFVKRVWVWKQEYGSTIVKQLRRLGSSCDWSRERFTMDEGLSRAVQTCFLELYKAGLIYRGYYLVNWCPRCQTALSDEEVVHDEVKGHFWHIRYPFADARGEGVIVATTRPETMLGDVAVAVHPEDERYRSLKNQELLLPILKRRLKIIRDATVDREFGTGAVKVTPAHDPTDFLLGQKHGLEAIRVMDAEGRMNDRAGPYKGLDRFECRKRIVADLEAQGLLEKIEDHTTAVGHCYRCRTIVEPTLSPQWFVKMKPLADLGIQAVEKDGMRFVPERWTKVYLDWLRNIRDWCISRQIWWGHRIPAWYCRTCYSAYTEKQQRGTLSGTLVMEEKEAGVHVQPEKPKSCQKCGGSDLVQDEDVLDTWFSSWLWPFSTLGWPEQTKDLATFYPTSVLVTAQDIIFFWVARMVMAGKFFMKKIPFKDVYIHGIIRVEGGKKMSKSLGNIIDPLEVIEKMGADALRFSIAHMTSEGQDLYLSDAKFLLGRNFANKIWNASRLILEKAGDRLQAPIPFNPRNLTLADRWIVSRLQRTAESVTDAIEGYRFNEAARRLYAFVWHEFCDWYLEIAKIQRESGGPEAARQTDEVLLKVLETVLRLLHPFMPFITEELWHKMGLHAASGTILRAAWPEAEAAWLEPAAEGEFERLMEVITQVRNIRSTFRVPVKQRVAVLVKAGKGTALVSGHEAIVRKLAAVDQMTIAADLQRPKGSVAAHLPEGNGFDSWDVIVPLAGLVDLEVERKRIQREIEDIQGRAKAKKERLQDSSFRANAPQEVVAEMEDSLKELESELSKWQESLKQIQ
ncbi:MAG: valine--tRNA ligase [Candidatus Omnitrophica bacterium]|nr:valine--tRNA ligase [Candidatus Omnitrophota bacterium]